MIESMVLSRLVEEGTRVDCHAVADHHSVPLAEGCLDPLPRQQEAPQLVRHQVIELGIDRPIKDQADRSSGRPRAAISHGRGIGRQRGGVKELFLR